MGILAELARGGLVDTSVKRIDYPSLEAALNDYDIMSENSIKRS